MSATPRIAEMLVNDPVADEELRERVCLYLTSSGHAAVRSLHVQARNGVVTLRGTTSTYYHRQLAVGCTRRVAGVRSVVDEIVTASPPELFTRRPAK